MTEDEMTGLSYEAALVQLDEIIARLELGDVELEAAIAAYERGAALASHCAQLLDRTEQKITQLVEGPRGEIERPFHLPADRAEAQPVPRARPATAGERLFGDVMPPHQPASGAPISPDDIPF